MKKVRFNLTEAQYERLSRLAKAMGVSRSEALRYVVEVYVIMKEAEREGANIAHERKDGTRRLVEIVG